MNVASKAMSGGGADEKSIRPASAAFRRLARGIVFLVWPLIWVGGLVTTYDAGMSVPDWPNTYGHNLLLYPYQTWLLGPFDLFIEHGHRLLASVIGFLSIALVAVAFWKRERTSLKTWSMAVLAMVIAQGVLGGIRVVWSDQSMAMVHGCFGPAFFVVCALTALAAGPRGMSPLDRATNSSGGDRSSTDAKAQGASRWPANRWLASQTSLGWARGLSVVIALLAYGQLVLGATLRHALPTMQPGTFAAVIATHVTMAFALWLLVAGFAWLVESAKRVGRAKREGPAVDLPGGKSTTDLNPVCDNPPVLGVSRLLVGLVGLQIALGLGTWVVHYGWPRMLAGWGDPGYLLESKDFVDAWIVTGHVATGSLILALSAVAARRLWLSRVETSDSRDVAFSIAPPELSAPTDRPHSSVSVASSADPITVS